MNIKTSFFIALLLFCLLVVRTRADEAVRFNRDIRPLLSQNCFRCHGPDEGNREADLRLDQEGGIRQAFKPGNLKASEAWRRINSNDPDERMPPPGSELKLNPSQIA